MDANPGKSEIFDFIWHNCHFFY